jgi:hypothetical protein
MPVSAENERMYVTVSKDMMKRIDEYRAKMGLSRSAFCAFLIGQGVISMDKAVGIFDSIGEQLKSQVVSNISEREKAVSGDSGAVQLGLSSCADCINPCKDDSDPSALAYCEHFRPAK